jgi:2-keto-3-deoxy-L-rhamnonate aldolase RhmA
MLTNPVKDRLRQGLPSVGNWISLPSASVAEVISAYQPDWLVFDTEHGPAGWERVEDLVRAVKGTEVVPFVRIVNNDPGLFKQAFDRGAFGAVVPMVNTPEQARAAVGWSKYPPDGIRGVAGSRVNRYGLDLPDYFARWNDLVLVVLQIETPEALDNVEAIAAIPGVDVLFVGPNDLSASLGVFRQFGHPEFGRALDRVLAATRRHGIAAGYMASTADEVLQRIDQGFRFVSAGSDTRMLASVASATYKTIRDGLAERKIPARA